MSIFEFSMLHSHRNMPWFAYSFKLRHLKLPCRNTSLRKCRKFTFHVKNLQAYNKTNTQMVLCRHNWLFLSEWAFKTVFLRHYGQFWCQNPSDSLNFIVLHFVTSLWRHNRRGNRPNLWICLFGNALPLCQVPLRS